MKNRTDYPDNWYDEIRPKILLRDKKQCQKCGVVHRNSYVWGKDGKRHRINKSEIKEEKEAGNKAYQIFLQIAHLDHNTKNNDESNLLSLCVKCHLNNDRAHNNILKISKTT
jgi:hypothetical protein